ncbi:Cyclin-dependent kinases regulatory subunit (Cell division control protein cks1), partial [Lathyrus oleraceus]
YRFLLFTPSNKFAIYSLFPPSELSFSILTFSLFRFKSSYSQTLVSEAWVRSSTLRSILMIIMSIGMLFCLLKLLNCFLRIGFSLKTSGVLLVFSRAVAGFIMLFIVLSHTLCFSGGL